MALWRICSQAQALNRNGTHRVRLGRGKMPLHCIANIAAARHGSSIVAQIKVPASGIIVAENLCWEEATGREPDLDVAYLVVSQSRQDLLDPDRSRDLHRPVPNLRVPEVGQARERPKLLVLERVLPKFIGGGVTGLPQPSHSRLQSQECRESLLRILLSPPLQLSNQRLTQRDPGLDLAPRGSIWDDSADKAIHQLDDLREANLILLGRRGSEVKGKGHLSHGQRRPGWRRIQRDLQGEHEAWLCRSPLASDPGVIQRHFADYSGSRQ